MQSPRGFSFGRKCERPTSFQTKNIGRLYWGGRWVRGCFQVSDGSVWGAASTSSLGASSPMCKTSISGIVAPSGSLGGNLILLVSLTRSAFHLDSGMCIKAPPPLYLLDELSYVDSGRGRDRTCTTPQKDKCRERIACSTLSVDALQHGNAQCAICRRKGGCVSPADGTLDSSDNSNATLSP